MKIVKIVNKFPKLFVFSSLPSTHLRQVLVAHRRQLGDRDRLEGEHWHVLFRAGRLENLFNLCVDGLLGLLQPLGLGVEQLLVLDEPVVVLIMRRIN